VSCLVTSTLLCLGADVSPAAGGYLGQFAGWQWDFFMPAIVTGVSFIVALFCLPETLFSRGPLFLEERSERSYRDLLLNFWGNLIPQRHLHIQDFLTSFYMLKYPSILFPFWFYTWSWTFINILPAITMAKIYGTLYGFSSGPIGLCTGIPLVIGCLIGELSAGKLSDVIMYRKVKRNDGVRKPEHRLYLTWLSAFLGPIGMIIFGVCLGKKTMYIFPLIGLGVGKWLSPLLCSWQPSLTCIGAYLGVIGLQISSTCLYAYVSDCYRPQTPESAVLLNLSRGLSFVVGFFWLPMVDEIGYAWTWVCHCALIPLLDRFALPSVESRTLFFSDGCTAWFYSHMPKTDSRRTDDFGSDSSCYVASHSRVDSLG
jgi:hypothetical protein